jgi:hypothetical protein
MRDTEGTEDGHRRDTEGTEEGYRRDRQRWYIEGTEK